MRALRYAIHVLVLTCLLALAGCSRVHDGLARLRGDAYRRSGRHAAAVEAYMRIPTNRQALAVIQSLAECHLQIGAYSNALTAYGRTHKYAETEDDLAGLALVLLELDAYAEAVPILQDLVDCTPGELGYCELLIFTQLRTQESNAVPAELARLEPKLDSTPTNLALLASWYMMAGDGSNAVRLLEEALAKGPDYTEWRIGLASALVDAGDLASGLSNLQIVAAQQPDNAEVQQLLGYTLTEMGETDAGIAAFRRAIRLDQDNALALNNLAYTLLLNDRNLSEAYELAHSAVQLERASFTLDTLAYACYKRGAHATALRYLREAERLSAREGRGYDAELDFHYGLVLTELGRIDDAVPRFRRALASQPGLERLLRCQRYYDTLHPHLTTHQH